MPQQRLPASRIDAQAPDSSGKEVINTQIQGKRLETLEDSSQEKELADRQVGKKPVQQQSLPGGGKKNVSSLTTVAKEGSREKIQVGQQAVLKVDSRPQGAELYIDGARAGTTPLILTATATKHEVKLKLAKHLGWEAQLDLSNGGEVPLSIQLLPETAPNP
jgi:hypothetical protein